MPTLSRWAALGKVRGSLHAADVSGMDARDGMNWFPEVMARNSVASLREEYRQETGRAIDNVKRSAACGARRCCPASTRSTRTPAR